METLLNVDTYRSDGAKTKYKQFMNTGDNMQTDILIIHTIMHLYHICIYIKVVRNKLTIIKIGEFQNVQPVSKQ